MYDCLVEPLFCSFKLTVTVGCTEADDVTRLVMTLVVVAMPFGFDMLMSACGVFISAALALAAFELDTDDDVDVIVRVCVMYEPV